MENTIKFRKQIFEEMMREDKDPKNRENWEKLCCSQTPLVPFIGAGVSAWCYPMWNELLKEVVKDNFSDSCAAAVEKALECRQKPFVEEEDKFHWMEEIAECIFNDKPSPEEKRRFAPLAPPLEQGNQASEKERKLQKAMLDIKKRYGKNALLKGVSLVEGATAMDRNNQIGGHRA